MMMIWKAVLFLLAIAYTSIAWHAFNSQQGAYGRVLTVDDKWSVIQLGKMALGKEMATVASRVTRIDQADASDIRAVILAEASYAKAGKKSQLADFARNYDPAAACATEDTAGWGGVDKCAAQCGNARSFALGKAPHVGTCLMLCMVAVQPCTSSILAQLLMLPVKHIKGNMSWPAWAKKRSGKMQEMFMTVVNATAATLKAGIAGGKLAVMTYLRNGDWVSLLVLLLPLLLVVHTTMGFIDVSALVAKGRRADNGLGYLRRDATLMQFNRVCRARPKKCSQKGLYFRRGVSRWLFRDVVKAKDDTVRRRAAAELLPGAEKAQAELV